MPYDRITVSELQRETGIARTTFYRSFDTVSDILYWKCDSCFYEVLGSFQPQQFTDELALARHYFSYWMKHSDILERLIRISRLDIIYDCHKKNADILEKRFGAVPGLQENHGHYFMAVRTGFTISILTEWLRTGKKETADEIAEIMREQLEILVRNIQK